MTDHYDPHESEPDDRLAAPRVFTVYIPGRPIPQGSKRHVGNGRMIESAADLGSWREKIDGHVRNTMIRTDHPGYGHGVAVEVVARFYIRRPMTVRRAYVTVKPDLDKLLRAVFDALTASSLIVDDAQIVRVSSSKHYALPGRPPGALIHVRPHEATR